MSIVPRCCGVLLLALGTSAAFADRKPQYFGVHGLDRVASEYEIAFEDGGRISGDLWRFKLGYEFGKFLGAEVHYGFEAGGDGAHLREGAAFGRFQLPYERLDVYLLAGAGRVGYDRGGDREVHSGPAGGLGIDFYGTDNTAISLEYVQYRVSDDDLDHDYDAVTLGLVHHFDWPAFR